MRAALVNILGSNALSQLLIVASTPLLTRTYPQADFGWFGVATTLALVSSTLLTLRLEHSIHVTALDPARLYGICLTLAMGTALLIGVPGVLIWIVALPVADHVAPLDLALILVYALAHATLVVSLIYLNYQQRFRLIATISLLVPIVFVGGALSVPLLPGQPNALLFWQTCAFASGASLVIILQRRVIAWPSMPGLREALSRERANWQFLVPSQLLSIVSLNLSVIGAAWLFDPAVAGLVVIAPADRPRTGHRRRQRPQRSPARRHPGAPRNPPHLPGDCRAVQCRWPADGGQRVPDTRIGLFVGARNRLGRLRAILLITVIGAAFQLVGTSVISMLTSFDKRSDLLVNCGPVRRRRCGAADQCLGGRPVRSVTCGCTPCCRRRCTWQGSGWPGGLPGCAVTIWRLAHRHESVRSRGIPDVCGPTT